MTRYYFHFRDGVDSALDPDGRECDDLQAVGRIAVKAARDIIASEVRTGAVDLRYRIDVEDGTGALVHTIDFEDAVTFSRS